uniref:Uncharacterized protein n=1 Tax=Leersia perrieri TaxID=77586 RepID=A0A0D9VZK2_9ORYZ
MSAHEPKSRYGPTVKRLPFPTAFLSLPRHHVATQRSRRSDGDGGEAKQWRRWKGDEMSFLPGIVEQT